MAVKFELLWSRSYRFRISPKKEADAKKLGAHKFIVTKMPSNLKVLLATLILY
jgi:D-arabinose 1-dehydrogenase-like Zn-dependent alcohol dehydrogenase